MNDAVRVGSNKGMKFSDEVKLKMSEARRALWEVPGNREKFSKAMLAGHAKKKALQASADEASSQG